MARVVGSVNVIGLVIFGTCNSLLGKIVYQVQAPDCQGVTKEFRKPWAMTAAMFVAMAFCLPIAFAMERWPKKKPGKESSDREQEQPLLEAEPSHQAAPTFSHRLKEAAMLSIPTLFDLAATTLMNVGLLYVAASVFQMLRGAEMVFAAMFSVLFLRRSLNRWHYLGIALCVAGITLVGTATLVDPGKGDLDAMLAALSERVAARLQEATGAASSGQAALGMGLVVLSQAVQAAQVTVEDYFMADLGMHPLKVVGYEGLLGSFVMLGVALPVVQALPGEDGSGIHEDTLGTLCMLRSSRTVLVLQLVSAAAVLGYNISGMMVTDELGAAARTVLETTRTLFVWLAAMALYYSPVGHHELGEPWDKYSWVQAVGFAILVGGTMVYDKGSAQEVREAEAAGTAPPTSKWAVLKHTLLLSTGHPLGPRGRFRAAGHAVLASIRMEHGLAGEGGLRAAVAAQRGQH